jgi:hypothetical protein
MYKGFTFGLRGPNHGKQYAVGEHYKVRGKIETNWKGFHACARPIDVLVGTSPGTCVYGIVTVAGRLDTNDTYNPVTAASDIRIDKILTLDEFVEELIAWCDKGTVVQSDDDSVGQVVNLEHCYSVAWSNGYNAVVKGNVNNSSVTVGTGKFNIVTGLGHESVSVVTNENSVAYSEGFRSVSVGTANESIVTHYGDHGSSVTASTGTRCAVRSTGCHSIAANTGYSCNVSVGNCSRAIAASTGHDSCITCSGPYCVAVSTESDCTLRVSDSGVLLIVDPSCLVNVGNGGVVVFVKYDRSYNVIGVITAIGGKDIEPYKWHIIVGDKFVPMDDKAVAALIDKGEVLNDHEPLWRNITYKPESKEVSK